MAPEVARGKEAGPPFDQYALALVVYEALSGRLPHEGTTPLSVITKRAYEPPADLAAYVPDAPAGVVDAVMKALAREPEERFPSCSAFATAYATGLGTDPVGARSPGDAPAPRARVTTVAPDSPPVPTPAPARRVRLGVVLAGAVAVIATIVAAATGMFDRWEEVPPPDAGSVAPVAKPPSRPPWKLDTPPGAPDWVRISESQASCAARHGIPAWIENAYGMHFVLIPEGKFRMGSPADEAGRFDGEDQHEVTIRDPFYLQTTEVTNGQYRQWKKGHRTGPFRDLMLDADGQPAGDMTFAESESFAAAVSSDGRRYRLPSEEEWEYACRGGTMGVNYWGASTADMGRYANVSDKAARTRIGVLRSIETSDGYPVSSPAGSLPRNPWGLFDMIGNVTEFVRSEPPLVRGGSWVSWPEEFRSAARMHLEAVDSKNPMTGFRLAAELPGPPSAAIEFPAEAATLAEGVIDVRGAVDGVPGGTILLVNGVAAACKGRGFEATITLPPGDQEIEVLVEGKSMALRKVKVTAAPRPAPPSVPEWAKVSAQQAAEAKRLGVPVAFENGLGMRFVLIPGGRFDMGSPPDEPGRVEDEPIHAVTLTRPFYLQTAEATNGQYRKWLPEHSSGEADGRSFDGDGQPARMLVAAQAAQYCVWLGLKDSGRRYRLPTEAEWEYACRAGTRSRFFWGDTTEGMPRYANVADEMFKEKLRNATALKANDGWYEPSPAGSYLPNPWGLYDVLGNLHEMVSDRYAPYPAGAAVDPPGPSGGEQMVVRGGGYDAPPSACRAAARVRGDPKEAWLDAGLRVACDLEAPPRKEELPVAAAGIVEPSEGAMLMEGAVPVRGSAAGLAGGAVLRVNGIAAQAKGGEFTATITLPPGEQEIEVLVDAKSMALRKVKVTAAPRPAPPSVPEWAKVSAQQAAEAKRLGVPVAFENGIGMRFVLIPAGRFLMGSPPDEKDHRAEEILHPVHLTRPFYLQATEVTNAQYRRLQDKHATGSARGVSLNGDAQPVGSVEAEAADAFARWLSTTDAGRAYRLATEAEFEYAARAGTRGRFWWGDSEAEAGQCENLADKAAKAQFPDWVAFETDDGAFATTDSAHYRPNPWGLWDMLGNVGEWCRDQHREYPNEAEVDPTGPPGGSYRAARGGCSTSGPVEGRAAYRVYLAPGTVDSRVGFRVACDVPAGK